MTDAEFTVWYKAQRAADIAAERAADAKALAQYQADCQRSWDDRDRKTAALT